MKNNDCSLISKYRSVLMGIAIAMIMFCHFDVAQLHHDIPVNFIARTFHTFTVGVDIFLFLSGVGLYYSFTKKKTTYIDFQKKRIVRLFPLYFVIAGLTYFISDLIINNLGIGKFLRDLFFVSWFTEASTRYWYILAIAVFYLVFPFLYKYIHGGSNGFVKAIIFSICWYIAVEALCYFIPGVSSFRIALERLPIFTIGIYCGKLSYDSVKLNNYVIIVVLILGFFLFCLFKTSLFSNIAESLYYPVRAFLSLSIIITIIAFFEFLKSKMETFHGILIMVFSWFGSVTLELYLLHQSYMILFDFPYKALCYCIVAFGLPTTTALLITIYRKKKVRK